MGQQFHSMFGPDHSDRFGGRIRHPCGDAVRGWRPGGRVARESVARCPALPFAQHQAGFAQCVQLALYRGPTGAGSLGQFAGTQPGEIILLLGTE
ncbi:hypothetical protein G6F50_017068 [Rhizopus delemar]|uniref:Uncharacterized protein n=1 Tax=Rhizopus delemar TaxID=936053 RepID=A0A9P6XRP7_9FUNG|nr:hypothetical protein G6F50_017068 [Rhizopus delemar]